MRVIISDFGALKGLMQVEGPPCPTALCPSWATTQHTLLPAPCLDVNPQDHTEHRLQTLPGRRF